MSEGSCSDISHSTLGLCANGSGWCRTTDQKIHKPTLFAFIGFGGEVVDSERRGLVLAKSEDVLNQIRSV